ncbi:hypothetical protein BH20ACI4_BH20ACI4_21800 [soil metagenome]
MKKSIFAIALFVIAALTAVFWSPISTSLAQIDTLFYEPEPDIPEMLRREKGKVPKDEFLEARANHFGLLRGLKENEEVDPQLRQDAISVLEKQEEDLAKRPNSSEKNLLMTAWSPIGPAPIPNGDFGWSGRVISIAVHPANPNIVYVGTAQGGLYRSTDGGTNWASLMDGALSLAIGAIAISPSDPEIVYVGTGEHNFSADSFFGVGVYRISNASSTANLSGPFNFGPGNVDVFTGRGISRILVHPTDSNTIFVASTSGVGGIGAATNSTLPARGIYRSTNAASANPVFDRLTNLAGNSNASVRDIAFDPANPNILVAGVVASGGVGGIYRSDNALSATPTFTQPEIFNSTSTNELTTEFAVIHPTGDANATFYAATGNLGGRVLKSTNGGTTWTQQIDNNFCTPQCFYDIAVAVDPNDPNRVYLGGSPALVFGFSTNGGTSFTSSASGLHVDSHAIAVSPSTPSTIYFGSDGGIYKSVNSGTSWASLNNTQFYATQFMSVAVHPTDPNFSIGGTQDNGTNFYSPTQTWARVDGGDGGYAVIDQNAADTTNVRMYHTYFNSATLKGYATRATTTSSWSFRGCNGSSANDINCADTAVLFYAPLESGPGNPNTIYYGTDRLYRSSNNGTNHTVVSQAPLTSGIPLSAIGISPQNDNVRIVGQSNGGLFGTNSGSSTLDNLDPTNTVPNGFIARAVIDPNNVSTAYVTLSNFGVSNIYKTTNLNSGTPTWTNINGTGANIVPQVPVNSFVVDPQNSNNLYAGTDIGVYASTDGGANWQPFGTGLPRVAVFDMAITNAAPRKLRIATHGKGMYDITIDNAPNKTVFDFDGDRKTDVGIFRPAPGEWWINYSASNQVFAVQFGSSTDKTVPADFTGDGKTDIAFWRESTGQWFVLRSEDNSFYAFPFGQVGDIAAPGDFDGDGRADAAVYRPSNGVWYILRSSDNGVTIQQFGVSEDLPVVADYDGDGKADIAVFRPTPSQWWLLRSSAGLQAVQFGQTGDKTVPADYTGDGKADIAFYRPASGEWFVLRSEDNSFYAFPWGTLGDVPTPGDFDGDGRADAAVFRPSNSTWYLQRSTSGFTAIPFGTTGDQPIPNSYVRN